MTTSQSDVDENSACTLSPNGHEGNDEGEAAKKRRAQRRKNRKKLVATEDELPTPTASTIAREDRQLVLKPQTLPAISTVTFKEPVEIRPIHEGKIFVQKDQTFVPVSQDIFFLSSTQNLLDLNPVSTSPESVAAEYQRRFIPLATACHGLLAGIALWQICMVSMLKNYSDFRKDEEGQRAASRWFQIIFYIFSSVSLVAVLDWCIPSTKRGWSAFRKHLALQPLSLFALLASAASILAWALTAKLDDSKAAQFINGTSVAVTEENFMEFQDQWITLNLIRCVFAIVGFLLTALSQTYDSNEPPKLEHQHKNGTF